MSIDTLSTAVQLKRNRRETASTLASRSQPIASDSNAAVHLDRPSAHGARVVTTPVLRTFHPRHVVHHERLVSLEGESYRRQAAFQCAANAAGADDKK